MKIIKTALIVGSLGGTFSALTSINAMEASKTQEARLTISEYRIDEDTFDWFVASPLRKAAFDQMNISIYGDYCTWWDTNDQIWDEIRKQNFLTLDQFEGMLSSGVIFTTLIERGASIPDYDEYLFKYYWPQLKKFEGKGLRSPSDFKRCKKRLTEQFIESVDMVRDYHGHIQYWLNKLVVEQ